jgi:hypothetical protein
MCDELYGRVEKGFRLGLRAVRLAYRDTFTRRPVTILAPAEAFLKEFGFKLSPELETAKWVRPPYVPKEKGQGGPPPLPSKTA